MSGTNPSRVGVGEVLALAAVMVFSSALRAQLVDLPFERDEGQYAYIAWRWLGGALPYVDSFDQKPPGVYLAYAALIRFVGESTRAIHWGTHLYSLGSLIALFALGRTLVSPWAGIAAAAFLSLLMLEPSFLGSASNTETFLLLPLILSLLAGLLALRGGSLAWSFAAGALGGAACLFKQVAIFDLAFVGLVVVFLGPRAPSFRRGFALTLGAVAVALPILGWFAAHGALWPLVDHVVLHNLSYAARVPLTDYPANFWAVFAPSIAASGAIYGLALLGLTNAPARADARTNQPLPSRTLAVGWLLFSALGVASGGYFRHHYFLQAMPAIALLAGMGAAALPPVTLSRRARGLMLLVIVSLGLAIGVWGTRYYYLHPSAFERSRWLYGAQPFAESPLVSRFIAERTDPDETVYIFGSEPQILYAAGRRSASRYILAYPLFGPYADAADRQREALAEVQAARPAFIVTTTVAGSFLGTRAAPDDLHRGLIQLLRHDYRVAGIVPLPALDRIQPVSELEAERLWAQSPSLGDGGTWGSLAIFERRDRPEP